MTRIAPALSALAMLSFAPPAVHGPAHPIWIGRPRSRRITHATPLGVIRKGGKIYAPKGYAFNRRGDLVSLKREARRQRARRLA